MKLWLVKFASFGFALDAVVCAADRGQAIALLKLTADSKLDDALEIGVATGDLTPRVVTEDSL